MELLVLGLAGQICRVLATRDSALQQVRQAIEVASGIPAWEQCLLLGTSPLPPLLRDLPEDVAAAKPLVVSLVRRSPDMARLLQQLADASGELVERLMWWEMSEQACEGPPAFLWPPWERLKLPEFPECIAQDKELMAAVLRYAPHALAYAPAELREDGDFILDMLKVAKAELLGSVAEVLRADRSFMLQVLDSDVKFSEQRYCEFELQEAWPQWHALVRYGSDKLRRDPDLLRQVLPWYPVGKYVHKGREVLMIVWSWEKQQDGSFTQSSGDILFLDGSRTWCRDSDEATQLAESYGFRSHLLHRTAYDHARHGPTTKESWQALPTEDFEWVAQQEPGSDWASDFASPQEQMRKAGA